MKTKNKIVLFAILAGTFGFAPLGISAEEHKPDLLNSIRHMVENDREVPDELLKQFLEEYAPEMLPHLGHLQEHDKEAFRETVDDIREKIYELVGIYEISEQAAERMLNIYRMEFKSRMLADKIRNTQDPEQREAMIHEMRKLLDNLFEQRLSISEMQAKQLEKELHEVRTMLEKRRHNKHLIIERHMQEILHTGDELSWD